MSFQSDEITPIGAKRMSWMFLTACRRLYGVPEDIDVNNWPLDVMSFSNITNSGSGSSDDGSPHSQHTPSMEKTENHIYAYAIACSVLQDMNLIPNWILNLHGYGLPILVLLSCCSNMLVGTVMMLMGFRRLSTSLYISILALVDTVLILIRSLDIWIQVVTGMHFVNRILVTKKAFCTTFPFVFNFLIHFKSFVHIAIAVDTWLLYWRPIYYWQYLSPERIRNVIIFFVAVLLTINCQFLWTYDIINVGLKESIPKGNYCTYSIKWVERNFRDYIWPSIDFLLGEIFPLVFVLFFGLMSLYHGQVCLEQNKAASIRRNKMINQNYIPETYPVDHPEHQNPVSECNSLFAPRENNQTDFKDQMIKYIIDVPTFVSLRRIITCQNFLYTLILFPEIAFYIGKYVVYISMEGDFKILGGRINLSRAKPQITLFREMQSTFLYPETCITYINYVMQCFKFPLFYIQSSFFRKTFRDVFYRKSNSPRNCQNNIETHEL